jgi:hypothetical protein
MDAIVGGYIGKCGTRYEINIVTQTFEVTRTISTEIILDGDQGRLGLTKDC